MQLLGTFVDRDNCYILTELCSGRELWSECMRYGLPESRVRYYFGQILSGVSYMHRMGIVHRDIKAENIFLTSDLSLVKIGDFGTARDIFNPDIEGSGNSTSGRRRTYTHYVGTPHFMAHEAIDNKENDELSDIWSLGCLLYQMVFGIPPFVAGSEYLIFLRVKHMDIQFPHAYMNESMKLIIRTILQSDRLLRLSICDLMSQFPDQQNHLPLLSDEDRIIRGINRSNHVVEDVKNLLATETNTPSLTQRLQILREILEWEQKSQPGAGTAMLDHLNLPEFRNS